MHALGLEFGSAAQLSTRPGSVLNCLWGSALKRSPGIIRKSRVSYPGPGFLSSATWPSLPKKHYNGLNLNQTKGLSVEVYLLANATFFGMCEILIYTCIAEMLIYQRTSKMSKGLLLKEISNGHL